MKILFSDSQPKQKILHLHIKSYAIKDDKIKQHTVICTEFSIDYRVMCATSKCIEYIIGDM